jgi:hypothetical protein
VPTVSAGFAPHPRRPVRLAVGYRLVRLTRAEADALAVALQVAARSALKAEVRAEGDKPLPEPPAPKPRPGVPRTTDSFLFESLTCPQTKRRRR